MENESFSPLWLRKSRGINVFKSSAKLRKNKGERHDQDGGE